MSGNKLSIYYYSGTHWDREWYQDFQGFRMRLVSVVNELIEVLEQDPSFKVFHLDGQTIVLEDYKEIEPVKAERLKKLIQERRVLVGPWYVMPDEFLVSGESLIRNFMTGHRIAKEWGTEPWKFGYVNDIFGHIAQMPQILNGFGMRHALLGRGTNEHTTPAFFVWQSPDGSECVTFKLHDEHGYTSATRLIMDQVDPEKGVTSDLEEHIRNLVEYERKRSDVPVLVLMDTYDHQPVKKHTPAVLDMMRKLYPEAEVKHESLENMGREAEQYRGLMPVRRGELCETAKKKGPFLYLITHTLSSRYPLKMQNDQCQTLLEKWVQPMTALYALRGFELQKSYTDLAYKYLLQNHPHDSICGCSIDQVHKDMEYRFDQSRLISSHILTRCEDFEKETYSSGKDDQTRVLALINPLPFERNEVVTVDIDFPADYPYTFHEGFGYESKCSFRIVDWEGNEIPYALKGIRRNYTIRRKDQATEKVHIHTVSFLAKMPAMGKAEYLIVPVNEPTRYLKLMAADERSAENETIKLYIHDNGTLTIQDKRTGKEYSRLMSYIDDGEIGDGWFHVNPVEDRVITSTSSPVSIEKIEHGPSRVVFRINTWMNVPEEMDYTRQNIRRSERCTTLKITSEVGLSMGAAFVDVTTKIDNNAKDHRMRLKLPTGVRGENYFVNQAFAFVERKGGINPETHNWKEADQPEKQMGGIVGKRDADGTGLAFVSAYGLHECSVPAGDSEGSILVTLFRSIGKTPYTDGEDGGQILRTLTYRYGLMPLASEDRPADLQRVQDCLAAGIRSFSVRVGSDWQPPQPASPFALNSKDIVLSTLKRPESEEPGCVIARFVNLSPERAKAEVHSCHNIKQVVEVNLNEEVTGTPAPVNGTFAFELDPWKIQTYKIWFE